MILERLREETREGHLRVEGCLDLMGREWDRQGVVRLLDRFFGFYEPWEMRLEAALAECGMAGVYGGRGKMEKLRRDITFLRGGKVDWQGVKRCGRMPDFSDVPRMLGALYVIEGSTLGGQLITRRLEPVVGLEGVSFFRCYGEETGKRWREFQEVLLRQASSEAIEDRMVAAANETFAILEEWLKGWDDG